MDEQRGEDHRAADDGARRRHLGMDQPDPDRAEQRLEGAEQRGEGRRDQPRAGGEEGKAQAEIERAEGEQQRHVVRRRPRGFAACVAAKTAAIIVPRQVAGVMRTWAKRRVMTVAIEKTTAISSASPSPIGETCRRSDSETMMATPQITAAIATQVAGATRSRNSSQASSAANSGTPACISRMLATVV